MTRHHLDAPDALTDGAWLPDDRMTLRWVPDDEPLTQRTVVVAALLACPTCHAKAGDTCKSRGGNAVLPHTSRIIGRYCPCGTPLPYLRGSRRKLCDTCRRAEALASKRRTRARRAKCGTDSGFRRHRRLREQPCGPCLAAREAARAA